MTVLRPRTPREALRLFAAAPDALPLAGGTDALVSWNLGELDGRVGAGPLGDSTRGARSRPPGGGAYRSARHTRGRPRSSRHSAATFRCCRQAPPPSAACRFRIAAPSAAIWPMRRPPATRSRRCRSTKPWCSCCSTAARRLCAVDDLFAGPKQTHLGPGELIEAIELATARRPPDRQIFRKVGTRAAQAISKVVMAGLLWLGPDGRVEELRVAAGQRGSDGEAAARGRARSPRRAADRTGHRARDRVRR